MSSLLRICRYPLPNIALLALVPVLCLSSFARAADRNVAPTPDAIAQLEQQASHADPRQQVFLYTEIVHSMTQQASQQIAHGETQQAASTLQKVNHYAHLIQHSIVRNTRRLKDAQELMHNATYRLAQVLHLTSGQDRANVQSTLAQLDQVNDELLTQVFAH